MSADQRKQEPFLSALELNAMRAEVEATGFEKDALVGRDADRMHYGLNIAVAWPLPPTMEAKYREFAARAAALDPGAYVYPFTTTHVTVLTAVSFKRYPDPSSQTIRGIDALAEDLGDFLARTASDISPFTLEVGSPVLARAAAFLPMRNAGGEIAGLREGALEFCRAAGGLLANASAPRAIHSTVLRFRELPRDPARFVGGFDQMAEAVHLGTIGVDRLLVTVETKPYMRAGRIERAVTLGKTHG